MTYGDFEDIGGSVFPSGAASLSQREEGPRPFPTVATADAPPLAPRVPDVALPWALVPFKALAALQDIGIGSAQNPVTGLGRWQIGQCLSMVTRKTCPMSVGSVQ